MGTLAFPMIILDSCLDPIALMALVGGPMKVCKCHLLNFYNVMRLQLIYEIGILGQKTVPI